MLRPARTLWEPERDCILRSVGLEEHKRGGDGTQGATPVQSQFYVNSERLDHRQYDDRDQHHCRYLIGNAIEFL